MFEHRTFQLAVREVLQAAINGKTEVMSRHGLPDHFDLLDRAVQALHAAGVCHAFVDVAADAAKAVEVVVDSKTNYPAACNSVETVLLHRAALAAPGAAPLAGDQVLAALRAAGVAVKHLPRSIDCGLAEAGEEAATGPEVEYGDLTVAVDVVDLFESPVPVPESSLSTLSRSRTAAAADADGTLGLGSLDRCVVAMATQRCYPWGNLRKCSLDSERKFI